jgi:phenylalanyl-tRNA synthetase beta chain
MNCKQHVVGFELLLDAIPLSKKKKSKNRAKLVLSEFQANERDFAFIVNEDLPANDLLQAISNTNKQLIRDVRLFDVYQSQHMQEGKKSLALSVTIQADDHTLSEEELTSASNKIIESAKQLGAELRS